MTVLVVEHESDAPAGWMGEWLVEAGAELDLRRPYTGQVLPEDLSGHDALVVLGGSMDSWNDAGHPWLAPTKALLRDAAARRTPTLGICLGHQLAALALGGDAARNPAGQTMGVLPMGWADGVEDDPLFGAVASARGAVHWNSDIVVQVPPGATVLARTPDGAVQAARYAPTVWGVQLHPEVGSMILGWWAADHKRRYPDDAPLVDARLAECAAREEQLAAEWRPLGKALVDLARESGA